MTPVTNARIAGVSIFVYLVAGISSLMLAGRPEVGVTNLLESFSALLLGVTLYALTREVDADVAMIAMLCRIIEAVPGEGFIYASAGTLLFSWLLLRGRLIPAPMAWLGVAASTILVLQLTAQRAGLLASTGWSSQATWIAALPMLVFELAFGAWLLAKGIAAATPLVEGAHRR